MGRSPPDPTLSMAERPVGQGSSVTVGWWFGTALPVWVHQRGGWRLPIRVFAGLEGGADARSSDGPAARGTNQIAIGRGPVRPDRRLQQRAVQGFRTLPASCRCNHRRRPLRDRRRVDVIERMPLAARGACRQFSALQRLGEPVAVHPRQRMSISPHSCVASTVSAKRIFPRLPDLRHRVTECRGACW